MLSYWDPLLDFITQSQLSQFTGLWNSPRSTMTHILLMNMRSFALTLWQSHYSLCSTAVKAKASPIACLPSPSRGAGCHQDARPSFGGGGCLCWPPAALQLGTPEGSTLLCEWGEGRGKQAVTAGSEPPEHPQRTTSHPVALAVRVSAAASLLVCRCLLIHSLAPVLPWLQRQARFSHCSALCLSMCLVCFQFLEAKGHWALA